MTTTNTTTSSTVNEASTHDLWVEARQLNLDLSRPSPTTVRLTVTRPVGQEIVDGAVLLIGTGPFGGDGWPEDGSRYAASTVLGDPAASVLAGAQVVGFWSGVLGAPLPGAAAGDVITWEVTVTGADPEAVYYASVHAASQVLQYYPIGIQSYPLEGSRIEKDSVTYAGSIPSLPSAPLSPAPGQVYFDRALGVVQAWDAGRGVWIPTRADAIQSGPTPPGVLGQAYILAGGSVLRLFNGTTWVEATPSNLQLRVGSGWIWFSGVSAGVIRPSAPAPGLVYYDYTATRVEYWDGSAWQVPSPATTLMTTGAGLAPAFVAFSLAPSELPAPYLGQLFYDTTARVLRVWTGARWIIANTDQLGTPTTDKVGVGTDGSYDERLRLIKVLKAQLGWPTQCVELTEEQFNIAIDNALDTYRQLCVSAYERRLMPYTLLKDQQLYFLNSPADRTDAVVTVHKLHRLNVLGLSGTSFDNNVYLQTFLGQVNTTGFADTLSIHLLDQMGEHFEAIFAGDLPFTWNEARRELVVHRRVSRDERIVLEVELERSEQELLLDRWCKQWLQGWAMAECKEVLGLIRSKFTSGTPGPAGTITLNGDLLIQEARQDFTDLREQLFNYEAQNAEHGNIAFLFA